MYYVVEVLYGTEIPWQPGYAGRAVASDYIKSDSRVNCDIKTTVSAIAPPLPLRVMKHCGFCVDVRIASAAVDIEMKRQ